jgi:hypothetical protein
MRRWSTFLAGVAAGALLLYAVLHFHVINTRDGLHLVPKTEARLAGTYVDIREFGPRQWLEHPDVLLALQKADRSDLMGIAAEDAVNNGLRRLLEPAQPAR